MMAPILPEAALSQHVAVVGKTGSGKTSTAKLIAEQVVTDGARVCILDPIKSDWWGLTASVDGKHAGLPFHILGGPRAHVPLQASMGKAIGELVADGSLPLSIIDMADFEPGGQMKFFVDFAPTLMKKMRGVVYLFIEEAHLFAPKERAGMGSETLSIHWAKTLATAGRSKGIRIILCTQRTQALHNALLGSCDTMIAQRLTAPADKKPVLGWFKENATREAYATVSESLSSLPTGTGWVYSGECAIFEKRSFPRITTYDNSKTPSGNEEEHLVYTPPVDRDQLRALLGDAAAEAEANDPKALRAKIAELEQQLASGGAIADQPDAEALARERKAGIALGRAEGYCAGIDDAKSAILGPIQTAKTGIDNIWEALKPVGREADQMLVSRRNDHAAPAPVQPATSRPPEAPHRASRGQPSPRPAGSQSGPQQRILDALAWLYDAGRLRPDRVLVAFLADQSPRSSSYSNNLSALRTAGLIDYPAGNAVNITEAGLDRAKRPERQLKVADLHTLLQVKLPRPQWRILSELIRLHPSAPGRGHLAGLVDQSEASSSFSNNLSALRTLGFLDYTGSQGSRGIVATPMLFMK